MLKIKVIVLFCFVLLNLYANSQTVDIDQIDIKGTRFDVYNLLTNRVLDTLLIDAYETNNIAGLLQSASSVNIKSYGAGGGLSTISIRGLGSNQTSVNWNGFPLNSITTGDADLSMFSTSFFDNINISPGASASMYGSGTFGGAIELNNTINKKQKNGFSAGVELGSFGTGKSNIQARWKFANVINKTSITYNISKNNFPFTNYYKPGNPIEYRANNAVVATGIIHNTLVELPRKNKLNFGFYYFHKEKQIPEIAGAYGQGSKLQTDSNLKTYLRWNKLFKQSKFTFGLAYFNDFLHYTDKLSPLDTVFYIDSKISGQKVLSDASYRLYFSNIFTADLGVSSEMLEAETQSYAGNLSEINGAVFLLSKYRFKFLDINFSFREELSQKIQPKALFSGGFVIKMLWRKMFFFFNISNKFRRPTFNERYWHPGGNENLKYEEGISGELGEKFLFIKHKKHRLSLKLANFYNKINNQIQWIPEDGIWSAINNNRVVTKGIEADLDYKMQFGKKYFSAGIFYNFIIAETEETESGSFDLLFKQLVYVPKNTFKLNLNFGYNSVNSSLSVVYTEKRFTTGDNNPNFASPAFLTANFYTDYKFHIYSFKILIYIKIINALNSEYELIKSYPMPGRQFFFGIKYILN